MLKGMEPLPKSEGSKAEELARKIEEMIFQRGADANTRLGSKEELRQGFQVAHGTMNEAMRVLETRGVIELRRGPTGGVFVATPSVYVRLSQVFLGLKQGSATVEYCLSIRNHIEALSIVEAAKEAPHKPEQVKELYRLAEKMRETIGDVDASLHWNWTLHRRIAEMGANTVLTAIYLTLMDFIEQEVTEVAPARSYEHADRALKMHIRLIDAIASGDPVKAAEAAKEHPLPLEDPDDVPAITKKGVTNAK